MLGNNVIAETYDWTMQAGTDIIVPVYLVDGDGAAISLVNYTARMKIKAASDLDTALLDIDTDDSDPNSRIEITAVDGLVSIIITDTDSATIVNAVGKNNKALYDLELVDEDGLVNRVMKGEITPSIEITD